MHVVTFLLCPFPFLEQIGTNLRSAKGDLLYFEAGQLPTSSRCRLLLYELVKMRLTDAVDALNTPIELLQRVTDAREKLGILHGSLPSISAPVGNGNDTEAAATQPQQPPSSSSGLLLPPSSKKATGDAARVLSSVPATGKERERLFNAIQGVAPAGADVEAITDMLVSLPKKERALCLSNTEILRNKVEEVSDLSAIGRVASQPPRVGSATGGPVTRRSWMTRMRSTGTVSRSPSTASSPRSPDSDCKVQTGRRNIHLN
ncbi:unnamed protein product [Tilletia controversa]|nr:unnamed protein product [Tilletia controversa]